MTRSQHIQELLLTELIDAGGACPDWKLANVLGVTPDELARAERRMPHVVDFGRRTTDGRKIVTSIRHMTYLVTGDAVVWGRRPKMTCVRHRGGWCALKPGTKLDKTATSDATACGHFVTMRFESARRYPDCAECRKALGLKPVVKS